jgi:hypothetical protein
MSIGSWIVLWQRFITTWICPPVVPAGGVVRIPGAEQLYEPQIVTPRSYSVSINNGTNEGYIHWEFGAIQGPQPNSGCLTVPTGMPCRRSTAPFG